jgi:hypothetical protein
MTVPVSMPGHWDELNYTNANIVEMFQLIVMQI